MYILRLQTLKYILQSLTEAYSECPINQQGRK